MTTTRQHIVPNVWFDDQAEEAAKLYTRTFPNSSMRAIVRYGKEGHDIHGRPEGSVMTVDYVLDGQEFTALNGGPIFQINPSISFSATYESTELVDSIWNNLSEGGVVLMPMGEYPWSRKYGWLQDRFGVSWQIAAADQDASGRQGIITSLMYVKQQYGQAEEAMEYYTSIFRDSKVKDVMRYGADQGGEKEGAIMYSEFELAGQTFSAMDSTLDHSFTFNEAVSLGVICDDQAEIDYYWNKLSAGGDPKAQVCGWLKDRFGVSWQVTPRVLNVMLQDPDKEKTERVTRAFLKMKKFDIAKLEQAFSGG